MPPNPLFGFFWRFGLLYLFLLMPWPGWNELYGDYFRELGRLAFSRSDENQIVLFEPTEVHHGFSVLNTRMTLGNRTWIDNEGVGQVKMLDLDTRSIGWVPTALTAALILATPVCWRRRFWALLAGLLLIHLFILFSLQTWIWEEAPALSLSTLSPFWSVIVDDLEYALIVQLGASFSAPLLIWILVTFRVQDAKLLAARAGGGPKITSANQR